MLKYVASEELGDRLPGIIQLLVQIIDEPRGLECLKAVLVYFAQTNSMHSTEVLTEFLELCKTARSPEELQSFLVQANQN